MEQNGHHTNGYSNSNNNFKKVTHVLFDMDGVILDSECIYEEIVKSICRKYGKEYPRDVRLRVMGTSEQMTSEIVCRDVGLPITPEDFREQMNSRGDELFLKVKLMKGAKRLIEHLRHHKIPMALATSSGKGSVAVKTYHYEELFDLFDHKVMGSSDPDVKFGKPHPDIYLICASRFPSKPKPENCLVIEDAPNGVLSGRAAGMQVLMTPDPLLDRSLTSKATLVVDSLLDFRPEMFGLPPFKQNGIIN